MRQIGRMLGYTPNVKGAKKGEGGIVDFYGLEKPRSVHEANTVKELAKRMTRAGVIVWNYDEVRDKYQNSKREKTFLLDIS